MTYSVNCDVECWRVPQAPFQILYSRLALEQIRLAVVDAYFVVPHGGVEIGGSCSGDTLTGKSRSSTTSLSSASMYSDPHFRSPLETRSA